MILYYGLPGAVRGMGARRGPPILPPASIVREVAFNRRNHIASVASEPERTRAEPSSPTRSYFPETWLWKLLPLPSVSSCVLPVLVGPARPCVPVSSSCVALPKATSDLELQTENKML
ncbi:hypothetical protein E2C01_023682 [Portunus trituberculatus]|uniref:Uncharacterized protein n=1 Tax=Portunus trituberculatus TaxID=210409 RepID=A0A5B7E9S3_PORTR|nr:hypothetical protein [Portunus trituberculatus]